MSVDHDHLLAEMKKAARAMVVAKRTKDVVQFPRVSPVRNFQEKFVLRKRRDTCCMLSLLLLMLVIGGSGGPLNEVFGFIPIVTISFIGAILGSFHFDSKLRSRDKP